MQEYSYLGPMIPELTEHPFHDTYIPTGTGKKKIHNKYRKPPSRLAIYRDQFFEPNAIDLRCVNPDQDIDAVTDLEDISCPWQECAEGTSSPP